MGGGDGGEREPGDGDKRAERIEEHGGMEAEGGIEHDAEGGRADAGDAHEQLIEGVDAKKMARGDDKRHGGHHGRPVESLSDAAAYDECEDHPHLQVAGEDDEPDKRRKRADGQVGYDHHAFAVEAVGDDAPERRKESLGKVGAHGRKGKP